MSTRYVWEKFVRDTAKVNFSSTAGAFSIFVPSNGTAYACSAYSVSIDKSSNKSGVVITPEGTVHTFSIGTRESVSANTFSYIIVYSPNDPYWTYSIYRKGTGNYWLFTTSSEGNWVIHATKNEGVTDNTAPVSTIYSSTITAVETSKGYVSGNSSGDYPNKGYKEDYYYVYEGSDNIDPISITYPSSITYEDADTKLPYEIKPSTSNVYGGTIEYKKDSRKNGDAWDTTTSDWRTNLTGSYGGFDNDTQTYQLRVHVRDGWGFESSTYITGPVCTFTKKLGAVMQMCQGRDPQEVFSDECRKHGLDPNQAMQQIRSMLGG